MCRPNLDSLWAVIALSTWLPLFCCAESISSLHGSCWFESYRWCFQPQRSQRDCSGLFIACSLPARWPNRCRAWHPVLALTHPGDPWPCWRCMGTRGPPGAPCSFPRLVGTLSPTQSCGDPAPAPGGRRAPASARGEGSGAACGALTHQQLLRGSAPAQPRSSPFRGCRQLMGGTGACPRGRTLIAHAVRKWDPGNHLFSKAVFP